jgi:hypothetical protein
MRKLPLIMLMLAAGCTDKPKMAQISGRVLIDGKPLTTGTVLVEPAGHRAAMAKIDADGRFTLSTAPGMTNDGVVLGTHRAAVIAHETLGPGSQKWHAPKKYMSTGTSELTITVDGDQSDVVINLTWDGGEPFVETFGKE